MKKEDKDIEIRFENGHVPRRQNQNSNISHTAAERKNPRTLRNRESLRENGKT